MGKEPDIFNQIASVMLHLGGNEKKGKKTKSH